MRCHIIIIIILCLNAERAGDRRKREREISEAETTHIRSTHAEKGHARQVEHVFLTSFHEIRCCFTETKARKNKAVTYPLLDAENRSSIVVGQRSLQVVMPSIRPMDLLSLSLSLSLSCVSLSLDLALFDSQRWQYLLSLRQGGAGDTSTSGGDDLDLACASAHGQIGDSASGHRARSRAYT